MRTAQLDLFGLAVEAEPLSRIAHYGKWDARTGLPLCGPESYADRLTGEARAVYEAAFRAEWVRLINARAYDLVPISPLHMKQAKLKIMRAKERARILSGVQLAATSAQT